MRNDTMSEEIVLSAVKAHASLDNALTNARRAALVLEKATEKGIKAGMVSPLEAKKIIHMTRQIAGMIADVGAKSAEVHIIGTEVAKANDVDAGDLTKVAGIPLPQTRGGTR